METVKRMVLSQWPLLDTCMCALCWVLVIDVNWIVEKMSHQMASLPRHWTRASACSSKIQKFVQCSAHSCSNWNRQRDSRQRQDSWKPEHSSISNQRLFLTQGLRCLENSSFFSFQHCQVETLHWSDPLRKWKLWREFFSHNCDCLTPACVLSVPHWWLMWTRLLQFARLARHWTRAHVRFPAWQNLLKALLILARTGTGNVIPGSDKIPGSRNTVATRESRFEMSGKLQLSQLSTLRDENGSFTFVTGWHLLVLEMNWIAARISLSISNTGKTLD